jgi:hypothetical protein
MNQKLGNEDEILFRQIHPKMFEKGLPASDRFRPSLNDENKLSVDRSSIVTAAQSHEIYTANGYESAAVFGLTVGEFDEQEIDCHPDPLPKTDNLAANPAHALADYARHELKSQKNIAKKLKQLAIARGQLHPPMA